MARLIEGKTRHALAWLVVAAVLLQGLMSCTSLRDAGMPGMVYSRSGKPLQGVRILVEGKIAAISDANGRFLLLDPGLESQRDKPWQEVILPTVELELPGYRTVRFSGGRLGDVAQNGTAGLPLLWCRMSSARDLLLEAWAAMDHQDWAGAGKILDEALQLAPGSAVIRKSLALCQSKTSQGE